MGYPSFEGPKPPGPLGHPDSNHKLNCCSRPKHNQPNHAIPAVLARVTDFIHTLVGLDLSQDGPWDFTEKPLPKCSECIHTTIYKGKTSGGSFEFQKNHFGGLIEQEWKREWSKSSKSKQIWDRGKSSKSKSRGKITFPRKNAIITWDLSCNIGSHVDSEG